MIDTDATTIRYKQAFAAANEVEKFNAFHDAIEEVDRLTEQILQAMPYLEADNCQEAIGIFNPPKELPNE